MDNGVKITTILTSLNRDDVLANAIESFLRQDYKNKELVIVDGKSTDNSHKIIADFLSKNQNEIKWLKVDDNNIHHARNLGIANSSGDLIGFLGADDLLNEGIFTKISKHHLINSNYHAVYFNSYIVSDSEITFNNSAAIKFNKKNLIKYPPIAPGEAIYYRKEVFEDIKFNENNQYTGDYELNMALVTSGKKKYLFYPLNETGVFWFSSGGKNMSSTNRMQQRYETIAIMFKFCKKFSDYKKVVTANLKNMIKFNSKIFEAYQKIK
jgi:glycosyltransferase involved in cell wall biosynthesis